MVDVHTARDRLEHEAWLDRIQAGADALDLGTTARSTAEDLFLDDVPEQDRSKRARAAASLYSGALIAGEERSQTSVATAMDTSRLSVQSRWKDLLRGSGFDTPDW